MNSYLILTRRWALNCQIRVVALLIAFEAGTTTPYALEAAESRGELFVGPGVEVYAGMIIGLYNRQEDLEINVCKAKHLTNMRSKSSDGTVRVNAILQR